MWGRSELTTPSRGTLPWALRKRMRCCACYTTSDVFLRSVLRTTRSSDQYATLTDIHDGRRTDRHDSDPAIPHSQEDQRPVAGLSLVFQQTRSWCWNRLEAEVDTQGGVDGMLELNTRTDRQTLTRRNKCLLCPESCSKRVTSLMLDNARFP